MDMRPTNATPVGGECHGCTLCCYLGFYYDPCTRRDYKPAGVACKYIGMRDDGVGLGCSIHENKPLVCSNFGCTARYDQWYELHGRKRYQL